MQFSTFHEMSISRVGIGTKRMPTTDKTHVVRLDEDAAAEIVDTASRLGINYYDTSYSHHKGEAEDFLGRQFAESGTRPYIATGYFSLVDPRYDYVFQKQMKKLRTDCLDFYSIEGVCDLTQSRDIDSGAIDYFFEQKEKGTIRHLGFSSELSADYLDSYAAAYPWDFVRMKVNYFDWFIRDARAQYEVLAKRGIPIFSHAALRTGNVPDLKPAAREILREARPDLDSAQWALLFVKSLDNIVSTTVNVYSPEEVTQDARVFDDGAALSQDEIDTLERAAHAQATIRL